MAAERLFVDTNVFLRYLTDDVPEQAEAFEDILKQAGKGDVALVTNSLVIAELVWTMETYYQLPREKIQSSVLAILNTPGLEVEDSAAILQAMVWYVEKNVDYADACNAAWALGRGISGVCTFDRKHFSRFEGISVVVPGEVFKHQAHESL